MKNQNLYQEIKNALSRAGESTAYFTPETLEIIMQDRLSFEKVAASGAGTQDFFRLSGTAKTDFYLKNSCAYCVLLELLSDYQKKYNICVIFPDCVRAFHLRVKADSEEQAKYIAIGDVLRGNTGIYGKIIAEVEND